MNSFSQTGLICQDCQITSIKTLAIYFFAADNFLHFHSITLFHFLWQNSIIVWLWRIKSQLYPFFQITSTLLSLTIISTEALVVIPYAILCQQHKTGSFLVTKKDVHQPSEGVCAYAVMTCRTLTVAHNHNPLCIAKKPSKNVVKYHYFPAKITGVVTISVQ